MPISLAAAARTSITFALGDGAHTINLAGELPHLAADMDILGPGADLLTVRRDTGGDYSVFTIDVGGREPLRDGPSPMDPPWMAEAS
jgi:hypothetical protein